MPPVGVPSEGGREPPGSRQRSAPARPRPSPPRRGRGRFIRAQRRSSLPRSSQATGGTKAPPPKTQFTIDLRGSRPKPRTQDPFSSRRDGPRLVSRTVIHGNPARYATISIRLPPGARRIRTPEPRGKGQTRRPACAAARWADASLYATPPGRSRFMKVLTPGPANFLRRRFWRIGFGEKSPIRMMGFLTPRNFRVGSRSPWVLGPYVLRNENFCHFK